MTFSSALRTFDQIRFALHPMAGRVSRRARALVLTALASVALTACQPTTGAGVTAYDGGPRGAAFLAGPQAAEMLVGVCGASLPSFEGAETRMSQFGFSLRAPTGTQFHVQFDASMRVFGGPGAGNTCSLVFASADDMAAVLTAVDSNIGPLAQTSLGIATLYGDGALVIVEPPRMSGGRAYYTLRMLSER